MKIIAGKRYCWYPILVSGGGYKGKIHSGLFTGEFDKNGNAFLMTKYGETWSIPIKDLKEKR